MAGLIGLVIVIIFMIIMYRLPGVVAGVALILYTAIVLITLNAFDITLTLPGIAGIILGIGMAVDANVIKSVQRNLRWKHHNPDRISRADVAWFRYC